MGIQGQEAGGRGDVANMTSDEIKTKSIADDLKLHYGSLISGADFSGCRRYRWRLWRIWDWRLRPLIFIMLNPSTAGAHNNDPTIVRCMQRARNYGYGGIEVVNLYAWRATYPKELKLVKDADPIGSENDAYIAAACRAGGKVVLAWGAHADRYRAQAVYGIVRREQPCFMYQIGYKITKNGMPRHPLMLGYHEDLILFNEPRWVT